MYKILVYLLAIQSQAKNIHYNCSGSSFFSDHLLADRIFEGIQDMMDEINEIGGLIDENGIIVPKGIETLKKLVNTDEELWR